MARVKGGTSSINRHKKVLRLSKGYYGRSHSCYRVAIERLEKALRYAYRDEFGTPMAENRPQVGVERGTPSKNTWSIDTFI